MSIDFNTFKNCLESSKLLIDGGVQAREVAERHFRIFSCLSALDLQGPTLDVACGNALFYPAIKNYKPAMLPYAVTDLQERNIICEDQEVTCSKFECEKERLPLNDKSVNTILFCDVLEHLIVDPVWVVLEFNRVLKEGGHLIISTPNATHIRRVFEILQGFNSATEHHIKPTSIYQRHNREWTLREIATMLRICGFGEEIFSTHKELLGELESSFLEYARKIGLTKLEDEEFGPEIFFAAKKKEHKTLDSELSIDERWPDWLYTHYPNYRCRPKVFPIVIGDDYA